MINLLVILFLMITNTCFASVFNETAESSTSVVTPTTPTTYDEFNHLMPPNKYGSNPIITHDVTNTNYAPGGWIIDPSDSNKFIFYVGKFQGNLDVGSFIDYYTGDRSDPYTLTLGGTAISKSNTAGRFDKDGTRFGSVVYCNSAYRYYYTGINGTASTYGIGYATSTDGKTWTPYDGANTNKSVIYSANAGNSKCGGYLSDPNFIVTNSSTCAGYMYVTCRPPTATVYSPERIISFSTTDGNTFTDLNTTVVTLGDLLSSDYFQDTDATTLASHTGDVNSTWALMPTYSQTLTINNGKIYNGTTTYTGYYNSGFTPSSADYTVQADCIVKSALGTNDVCTLFARTSSSVATKYILQYAYGTTSVGYLTIYGFVNGSLVLNSGVAVSKWGLGTHVLRFSVIGSTLKAYVDGVLVNSTTDANITAAGYAGVALQGGGTTTGFSIDNFKVYDGVPSKFDSKYIEGGQVFKIGSDYILTYNGATIAPANHWSIGIAHSTDPTTAFTKSDVNPVFQYGPTGGSDTQSVAVPLFADIKGLGDWLVYYQGNAQTGTPATQNTWDISVAELTSPIENNPLGFVVPRSGWTGDQALFTFEDATAIAGSRSIQANNNISLQGTSISHAVSVVPGAASYFKVSMKYDADQTGYMCGFYVMEGTTQITGVYFHYSGSAATLESLASGGWSTLLTPSINTQYDVEIDLTSTSQHTVKVNGTTYVTDEANYNNITTKANSIKLEKAAATVTNCYFDSIQTYDAISGTLKQILIY